MTPEIAKPASKSLPLVHRKILVVDESLSDLQYYASLLQWQGHEVSMAATYAEGWLALEKEHFDLIVLSQGSREFEGRVVLEHAMEISRHLPVLVLADSLNMGCYLEAMQLGAADYIEKPVLPSEIARLIETHVKPSTMAARAAGAA